MADVFISFCPLDRERVQPIADRLKSLGYSLSPSAGVSAEGSESELQAARAVLTVWSHNARDATRLYAEAGAALDLGKLLLVRLDPTLVPAPFDALPAADMSGGGEWGVLEDALSQIVRNGAASAPQRASHLPPMTAPAAAGSPKLLTTTIAITLVAYAGAVLAAYNDVMSPEQLQIALVGMIGVAGACAALSAHRLRAVARAGG